MRRLLAVLSICAVTLAACAAPQSRGECVFLPRDVAYPHQTEVGGNVLYCNAAGVPQYLIDRAESGRY